GSTRARNGSRSSRSASRTWKPRSWRSRGSRQRPTPAAALRLRLLRGLRLARAVERDRLANERLECGSVDVFTFVDVDRAACIALEARVEQAGRILQRRA